MENYRNKSLPFLDDLFLKFEMIIEQKSLDVSLDSEKDYDNNIYYFILSVLLGGRSIYSKIKVNDGEQRQLVNNIFKQSSTSSTVLYFVEIVEFLTNIIPLICRYLSIFFRLIMKLVFRWIYRYQERRRRNDEAWIFTFRYRFDR